MQSSPNHHALLSLIYAFHSCLNKVILIFSRHTVSFHMFSKIYSGALGAFHPFRSILNLFSTHIWPILDPFRAHFDLFWTHFRPILDPFWTHFGTIFDRISLTLSIQYLVMLDFYDDSNYSCYSTKAGFH